MTPALVAGSSSPLAFLSPVNAVSSPGPAVAEQSAFSATPAATSFSGPSSLAGNSFFPSSSSSSSTSVLRAASRASSSSAATWCSPLFSVASVAAAAAAVSVARRSGARPQRRKQLHLQQRQPVHCKAAAGATATTIAAGAAAAAAPADSCEEVQDVVIVGAGLSGLAAALRLQQSGSSSRIMLTEAKDRVGGNVTTREDPQGHQWEEGPNSFEPGDSILSMACDVGLKDDILLADPKSNRFVWWDNQLRTLPASPSDAVYGDYLSNFGKLQAALGVLGWKERAPDHEESVKDFVVRHLGEEAFERLIDPFVSGIYAGDPSNLSVEAAFAKLQALETNGGSLFGGALQLLSERVYDRFQSLTTGSSSSSSTPPAPERDPRLPEVKGLTVGSFRKGMQQFATALAETVTKDGVEQRLKWKLIALEWDPDKQEHVLDYETPSGLRRIRSKAVVLTAPAHAVASILRPISNTTADALSQIPYPRVAAVVVEYPKSAFREPEHGHGPVNGFGQLHPRSQGIRTLGTLYVSSLFPHREPDEDKVMLLNFIGGARDPELFGGIENLSEGQLVEIAHRDAVRTLLKPEVSHTLPRVLGVKIWPRAIPQMDIGHNDRLTTARNGLQQAGVQGLFLAGNYVSGISVGRCIEYGEDVARDVNSFLSSLRPI
mmetsp:Transcript_43267/g.92587  ORF Transcript_43267/g.92587 Transcript_43267/m.92587 type:complete len:661 (+) Transcript_43267:98-2080(+)